MTDATGWAENWSITVLRDQYIYRDSARERTFINTTTIIYKKCMISRCVVVTNVIYKDELALRTLSCYGQSERGRREMRRAV
jgi:hypothetical protein